MHKNHAARLIGLDQWFRIWMPYGFSKLEAKGVEHVFLPLNRNHKPLGLRTKDWVDYQDYIAQAIVFPNDPHEIEKVWYYPETLHLYGDHPASRVDYFERLDQLLSRPMKLFPQST